MDEGKLPKYRHPGFEKYSLANASVNISVKPGDLIPLIPQQIFKAHANYEFNAQTSAGIEVLAVGKSFVRGNENSANAPDGLTNFGSGCMPGMQSSAHPQAIDQTHNGNSLSMSVICLIGVITRLVGLVLMQSPPMVVTAIPTSR